MNVDVDLSAIPQADSASLTQLEASVVSIRKQAEEFKCVTAQDYLSGDVAIGRIRKLDATFEAIYKPIKQAHDAAKKVVLDQERLKRTPLEEAKKIIGDKMVKWNEDQSRIAEARRKELEEREVKRAEEERLAMAEQLTEHAEATGNAALKEEAVAMLDQPLDLAPVNMPMFAPKTTHTKMVGRKDVTVTDMRAFLIELGLTLFIYDARCTPGLRAALIQFSNRQLEGLIENADTVEKVAAAFKAPLKAIQQQRGTSMSIAGVSGGTKKGIG